MYRRTLNVKRFAFIKWKGWVMVALVANKEILPNFLKMQKPLPKYKLTHVKLNKDFRNL